MTDDIIRRLREAIAAGTRPGEWRVSKHRDERNALIYDAYGFEVARVCYPNRDANATYIAAASPDNIAAIIAHVEAQEAEIERLTADRSRLLNAARRAVTALAAAAERTPEFQRDYEMLAGSLAPFRGEWPKEQR